MTISYIWAKLLKKIQGKAIKQSIIHPSSKVEAGSIIVNTTMDKYSFCGYDCKILNCDIGAFCSIADGVIVGGAKHPLEWVSTSPVFYKGRDSVKMKFSEFERPSEKRTIIGNDVWIGDRAIIKEGVKISDGAVIGMGSIVTHDVLPYEIVAGNPAHRIRFRFSDGVIEKLEAANWYTWDEETIKAHAKNIRNVSEFLEQND